MGTYILVIWSFVGMQGYIAKYDWKPIGEFGHIEYCEKAAKELTVNQYKCLRSKLSS